MFSKNIIKIIQTKFINKHLNILMKNIQVIENILLNIQLTIKIFNYRSKINKTKLINFKKINIFNKIKIINLNKFNINLLT